MKKLAFLPALLLFFVKTASGQCLAGHYTIGGTSPDFATFQSAVDSISKNGWQDTVWFDIRPGIYEEQLISTVGVAGNPCLSYTPVFFQKEKGVAGDATLSWPADTLGNFVLKLENSTNCIFEGITFQRPGADSINPSQLVEANLGQYFAEATFKNCRFIGAAIDSIHANGSDATKCALLFSGKLDIDSCRFEGGAYAVWSGQFGQKLVTKNCTFDGQTLGAFWLQGVQNGVEIRKNIIKTGAIPPVLPQPAAVRMLFCYGELTISQNHIESGNHGIFIDYFDASKTTIAHNFIVAPAGQAIYLLGSTYSSIIFNSIKALNGIWMSASNDTYAINGQTGSVVANIFDIEQGATLVLSKGDLEKSTFRSNCHVPNGNPSPVVGELNGSGAWDFSSWKNGDREKYSIQKLVGFVSPTDLHLATPDEDLNGRGIPYGIVVNEWHDIDGDSLPADGWADIGADQIPLPVSNASIFSIGGAQQRQACGESFSIKIAVKNTGEKPLTSALIAWKKNGQPQPDFGWAGNLPIGATDTAIVAVLPFLPDSVYEISFFLKEANGNEDIYEGNNEASFTLSSDLAAGDISVGFNGKFKSIGELSDRLSVVGLCGSARVVMLAGAHTGNLVLTQKLGLSAAKTLEITAEGGDRNCVQWSGGGNFPEYPVIDLQSVGHVWVHDLRLDAFSATLILQAKHCSNLLFENLDLQKGIDLNTYLFECDSAIFRNCSIRTGNLGLYIHQSRDVAVENCRLENFTFANQTLLKLLKSNGCRISGSTINGSTHMEGCVRTEVVGNEFKMLLPAPNLTEGFYTLQCDSLLVTNNFFVGRYLVSNNPLVFLLGDKSTLFAHNSINHMQSESVALHVAPSGVTKPEERVFVENNIIATDHPQGRAMQAENIADIVSDHNCFAAADQELVLSASGLAPKNLAAWQDTSGGDKNSFVFKPQFLSETDLHIPGNPAELAGEGLFLPKFSEKDIDGDPRPASSPDIGADQFAGLSTDARLVFMPEPACHGLPGFFTKLKNDGPDTLRRADIRWSANDLAQPTFSWKGALPPGRSTGWLPLGDYIEWPGYEGYKISAEAIVARDPAPLNNVFSDPVFLTKMGGDYTVGGPNDDFHNIREAAKMLNNVGQCADVRLRLRRGVHLPTWEFFIAPFQPDSLVTIIEPDGPGMLDGLIEGLNINQKPRIEFRRLRVKDVHMGGISHDILFENCEFDGYISSNAKVDNLTFSGCRFPDAQTQLYGGDPFNGAGNENLRFLNCAFGTSAGEPGGDFQGNQSPGNLNISGALNLEVRGCRFERTARLWINNTAGKLRVEGNTFGSSPGLTLLLCNFLTEDTARVANNFFHFAGHAPYSPSFNQVYQVEAWNTTYLNFWHNSLLFSPTNGANEQPAAFSPFGSTNLRFENNLVKTTGEARAFYWTDFPMNKSENNHFDPGPGGILNGFPTLGEWSSLSDFDNKSTTGAVKFEAENDPAGLSTDLHLGANSPLIPLTTNVLEKIITDFDGQIRAAPSTAIGADEPGGLPLAGAVWPGDCDGDKQVTSLDWLHLGLAIGQGKMGAARADQSISWSPKFAADWPDSIQQVNAKHSDCNGDGAATAADTLAVSQNFGQAHFAVGQTVRTGVPLFVDLPVGPFLAGQKIAAPLRLGSAAEPFYGAAIEVEFSQNAIQPGSFWADFSQNWLGSDAIGFFEKGKSAQIQLALTKTNGQDTTGFGQIGILHFEVGQLADSLKIRATGLRGLLADGSPKSIGGAEPPAVGVVVSTKNLGDGPAFELWPNPTDGLLFLKTKGETGGLAEVFDGLGRLVFSKKIGGGEARLDLGGLPGGFYQIRVSGEKGAAFRPVLVEN